MRTDQILAAAVEAAKVAQSRRASVRQWATVTAVDSDLVTATMDDGGAVYAQSVTKLPSVDDRVLVEFEHGACRIVGVQGGFA